MYSELVPLLLAKQKELADAAVQSPLEERVYLQLCGQHAGIQFALTTIAEIRSGREDHE